MNAFIRVLALGILLGCFFAQWYPFQQSPSNAAGAIPRARTSITLSRYVKVGGKMPIGPAHIQRPQRPRTSAHIVSFDHPITKASRRAAAAVMRDVERRSHQIPQRMSKHLLGPMTSTARAVTSKRKLFSALASCPPVYTGNSVVRSHLAETGINRWWSYEEDALGGIGKYMINAANGNLLVQGDDMVIPNKGIEIALRRTYNGLSSHDAASDDGSPNLYGDKWTNTFDAHIAYNDFTPVNCQMGVTLFDIDGAHYDYAPTGDGHTFTPPAGQYAQLYYNGTTYYWTKKTGTEYAFWDINQPASSVGYSGQIQSIFGRNVNNSLSFTRTWSTDSSTLEHLQTMTVTAEDGRKAVLNYGDVTGSGHTFRVLQSLTWPDNATTVTYKYTIETWSGVAGYDPVLTEVDEPGNNVASTLAQQYAYGNIYALLTSAYSPRWVLLPNQHNDGPAYNFLYGTIANVLTVQYFGDVNPNITDGYSSGVIQSSITAHLGYSNSGNPFRTVSLCYENVGGGGGCNADGGQTVWSDTDGHQTTYIWDGFGRVTQQQETTGDPSGGVTTLTTYQGWDSSNDLIYAKDARSSGSSDTTYETDYAYDNNGNTTTVGRPTIMVGSQNIRPTARYTYDSNNNVEAYCDPVFDNAHGGNWGQTYSCPTSYPSSQTNGGPELYTWSAPADGSEPFGQLTDSHSHTGYHHQFNYNTSAQGGGDYGLPTSVVGDSITQDDNNVYSPTQSFVYDGSGNLICYNKGDGWWALTYNVLGQQTAIGDPDDAALVVAACNKTPGLSGSRIETTKTFYPDGAPKQQQEPLEYAQGVSSSYTYDADGNELTVTRHYDYTAASPAPIVPTQRWYDGKDRFVEVEQPYDSRNFGDPANTPLEYFGYPWLTRYLYDLTEGGMVSISGSSPFAAHGNLFDTQLLLDGVVQSYGVATGGSKTWYDTKGGAYDALDRITTQFAYSTGSSLNPTTLSYDTSQTTRGLISSQCNATAQCIYFTYDALNQKTAETFSDSTPTLSYTFDADGRTATAISGTYGTESHTYNPDGSITQVVEPTGGGVTSPATITYDYYMNDARKDLNVSSSAFSQTGLFTYSYRADGLPEQQTLTDNVGSQPGTYTFAWLYTNAGRMSSRTDTGPHSLNTGVSYSYIPGGSGTPYGEISSYTFPAQTLGSYAYDAEGEPVAYSCSLCGSRKQVYNVRGESVLCCYPLNSNGTYPQQFIQQRAADGILFNDVIGYDGTHGWQYDASYSTFNAQMGAQLSQNPGTNSTPAPGATATPPWTNSCNNPINPIKSSTWSYDAAGRQTSGTGGYWYHTTSQTTFCSSGSFTKTYDALNRITSQQTKGWGVLVDCTGQGSLSAQEYEMQYGWGPNGHPILIGSSPVKSYIATPPPFGTVASDTIHWDGDVPLFTTNSAGTLDDIKIGTMGDVTPIDPKFAGLTIWDRDSSGEIISDHNSTGYDTFIQNPNPFHKTWCNGAFGGSSGYVSQSTIAGNPGMFVGQGTLLAEPGADGIFDGANMIQGVRTYDPTAQTWTTPDAYQGEVEDPMSQRPYMWDRNNPVIYSDPSGFQVTWDEWVAATQTVGTGIALTVSGFSAAAGSALGVAGVLIFRTNLADDSVSGRIGSGLPLTLEGSISRSIPRTGTPNSVKVFGKTTRVFGPNGRALTDYDDAEHKNVGRPHAHDWDQNGERGEARPLNPGETIPQATQPNQLEPSSPKGQDSSEKGANQTQ